MLSSQHSARCLVGAQQSPILFSERGPKTCPPQGSSCPHSPSKRAKAKVILGPQAPGEGGGRGGDWRSWQLERMTTLGKNTTPEGTSPERHRAVTRMTFRRQRQTTGSHVEVGTIPWTAQGDPSCQEGRTKHSQDVCSATLRGRYHYPHFADKETDVQCNLPQATQLANEFSL